MKYNIHLQAIAGLTSGCVGLSLGVVGSRFTVLGGVILETEDVSADESVLLPPPIFGWSF